MILVDHRDPVAGAARTGPIVVARIDLLGFDGPGRGLAAADLGLHIVAADLAGFAPAVQLIPYRRGQSLQRVVQAKHGAAPGQLGKGGKMSLRGPALDQRGFGGVKT
jgi:hypothetical protein